MRHKSGPRGTAERRPPAQSAMGVARAIGWQELTTDVVWPNREAV